MKLKSYCKVNLYLEVLNKRSDGYHNIDTLFQAVSLHDTLIFQENHDDIIIECNIKEINNQDNILWKVINKIKPKLPPQHKGLKIILNKIIPMGAGLGGGSSNAAMALLGLNNYYRLNLSHDQLIDLAAQIGADVPFFIKGGIARGQGIGEQLTFLEQLYCPLSLLIIYPNINISTKSAYDGINLNKTLNTNVEQLINGLKNNNLDLITRHLYNQFEETQFKHYPILKEIKQALINNGAKGALMSGSGSSLFGIFENNQLAQRAKDHLEHPKYDVFLAESIKTIN